MTDPLGMALRVWARRGEWGWANAMLVWLPHQYLCTQHSHTDTDTHYCAHRPHDVYVHPSDQLTNHATVCHTHAHELRQTHTHVVHSLVRRLGTAPNTDTSPTPPSCSGLCCCSRWDTGSPAVPTLPPHTPPPPPPTPGRPAAPGASRRVGAWQWHARGPPMAAVNWRAPA